MKRIKLELTEREAYLLDKALGYMTLDEDIDLGRYPSSWLRLYRDVNKKLRSAGADVEEA